MRRNNGIKLKTEKPCCVCGAVFKLYRSTQRTCSIQCENKHQESKPKKLINHKAIKKVSKKQAIINAQYSAARIQYLSKKENQVCFIDGCNKKANTVEHTRGRGQGYFDKFAEDNNICKTLDKRFWKPCCLEHNLQLENDSELSKKYQLSKLHGGKKN